MQDCIARFRDRWLVSFDGLEPTTEQVLAIAFLHGFSYFHT